jgi:hypothetical protein
MRHAACGILVAVLAAAAGLAPAAEIAGPRAVEPYRLVRLTAADVGPKTGVLWRVRGPGPVDFATPRKGRELVFVAPPGKYTVSLLTVKTTAAGPELDEVETEVVVGIPDPMPPKPVPPTPPDPVKPDGELGLRKASRDGAGKVAGAAAHRAALAKANRSHASAVAAGAFPDAPAYLAGWRDANKASGADPAAWKPWAEAVSARLAELHKAGKLPGKSEWAAAFTEIADGLGDN